MNEDSPYQRFLKAARREAQLNWYKKTGALAKKAGMSQGNLSKILNKKTTAPYETQIKILNALKIDPKEIFPDETIRPAPEDESSNIISFKSQVEKDHYDIIIQFVEKEKAKELNHALLEIEQMSKPDFLRLYGDILAKAEELKEERKKNQTVENLLTPDEKEA